MKQYSHAWLAFKAIKRINDMESDVSARDQPHLKSLALWLMHNEDDIIQGAWYPDAVIKDMATSHVYKMTPSTTATNQYKELPQTHLMYQHLRKSTLNGPSFDIDPDNNLPDRCDALAHSAVDNMKVLGTEEKGSAVVPTSNHVALIFFMLSHYIADAHMPLHCDSREFSSGANIHALMEEEWDDLIRRHYEIDSSHKRFLYDPHGYPLRRADRDTEYQKTYLKKIEDSLQGRPFSIDFGKSNKNTWDYIYAICQYSFLMAYTFIPAGYDHSNVTTANWKGLGGEMTFEKMSVAVLSDAIESIAHVWFRVWRRYREWAGQG